MSNLKSAKLLRTAVSLKKRNIPIIPSLIQKFLRLYYGFEVIVSKDLKVGDNVHFAHNGLGTVINQEVSIGNNVKIYQNVTIGRNKKIVNSKIVNNGSPVIHDDVIIFSGAVIVGDIEIGKGSVVGANVVLTESIPAGSLVLNNQPLILEKKIGVEY